MILASLWYLYSLLLTLSLISFSCSLFYTHSPTHSLTPLTPCSWNAANANMPTKYFATLVFMIFQIIALVVGIGAVINNILQQIYSFFFFFFNKRKSSSSRGNPFQWVGGGHIAMVSFGMYLFFFFLLNFLYLSLFYLIIYIGLFPVILCLWISLFRAVNISNLHRSIKDSLLMLWQVHNVFFINN